MTEPTTAPPAHGNDTGADDSVGDSAPADNSAISVQQVAHVARLARIELTPDEIEHYTGHLAQVLDHAGELSELDLSDVPPLAHPYPLRNVFRDDVVGELTDRDEVLRQSPGADDGQFEVPPVLGTAS